MSKETIHFIKSRHTIFSVFRILAKYKETEFIKLPIWNYLLFDLLFEKISFFFYCPMYKVMLEILFFIIVLPSFQCNIGFGEI